MNKVSVCMIVRDEGETLEECMMNLVPYADEIIIVDTGSIDNTKLIARKYTDKVYDFVWVNDFSSARNFSISKATNDYILVIDADEIVHNFEWKKFNELNVNRDMIGKITIVNQFTRKGVTFRYKEKLGRVFHKHSYHYEGTIHEQLVPLIDVQTRYYNIPLVVEHSGYEAEVIARKNKTERNISLLLAALKNKPEDPYIIYQVAKSYYMDEQYETSCQYFSSMFDFDLDSKLDYVIDAVESYGYALINSEQYDLAMQLLNIYDEFSFSSDFVYMMGMILMNNEKFSEAIEEFKKASKMSNEKIEGVNSYLSNYNIAVIYECLGDVSNARKYYNRCNGYKLASDRIKLLDKMKGK